MNSSAALVLLCGALNAAGLRPFEAVEPHMGTLVRIKLYTTSESEAKAAFRAAFDRITQLDGELSDYKLDSELNRLCRTAFHNPTYVSTDLFRVLDAAQNVSSRTGGAFDVTIGPLTHLWRENRNRIPGPSALQSALARCGYQNLHLDKARQTVSLDLSGMQLDLGGIAKGFAADEALAVLQHRGIVSTLVAASGDLAFSDAPPGKPGWEIGVDSLDDAGQPFTRTLTLTNAAVSTSGDTEQHLDTAGKRYSHIIDPHTGIGLTNRIAVTIVARHGIDADPNATAVSVLGCKAGVAYINSQPELSALLVIQTNGGVATLESKRFSHDHIQQACSD